MTASAHPLLRAVRLILPVALGPAILPAGGVAQTIDLPEAAPIPEMRDDTETPPDDAPVPTPRPEAGTDAQTPSAGTARTALSADERACRASLRDLGVKFVEHDPIFEEGCAVAHPVTVTSLADDIALEPEAVLSCATAETAARFVRDVVAPAAEHRFDERLSAVRHASAYVCRRRAGGGKMSEHAFGRALDIASFTLADERNIEVRRYSRPKRERAAFLAEIRMEACGPFKTVLGPGTDADHGRHFHFDLAERSNGATYCH